MPAESAPQWQLPAGKSFYVVVGPTASGKSRLALELARAVNGEIVGCDSVQVYRGFDIGSAKPTRKERALVPHHLVDVVDWNERFDAGVYAEKARAAVQDILARGRVPIVVGGTGLYLRAFFGDGFAEHLPADRRLRERLAAKTSEQLYKLLARLDKRRAEGVHQNDRYRLVRSLELRILLKQCWHDRPGVERAETQMRRQAFVVKVMPERQKLRDLIQARTRRMLDEGLLGEVRSLREMGVDPHSKPMQSIGYREVNAFLEQESDENSLIGAVTTSSCQYAKRQFTWFKKLTVDHTHYV